MSKTKISASATGLPSRRLFLASGPAAAVLTSLRKAAAEESPIAELIKRHKAAYEVYGDHCTYAERPAEGHPRRAEMIDEWDRLSYAAEDALDAICAHRAASEGELRAKAEYLARHFEENPWTEEQIGLLLRSLMDG